MLNLDEFVNKAVSEQRIEIPTDSVVTEIQADRKHVKILKLYDREPILEQAEFFRKLNRANRGFSREREFRHIGLLPVDVAIQIIRAANGDQKLEAKFVKKWLKHHPKFLTIDRADSF